MRSGDGVEIYAFNIFEEALLIQDSAVMYVINVRNY
jgi:hypothetical protein